MHHDVKSITKKKHLQQQQQLLKRTTVMNNSTRFKLTDDETNNFGTFRYNV
jgi:hypothetical protein